MAMCPLCSQRAGKRFCPAKDAKICAVCCGTKREIEIDCPSSCPYLKASRSYELEKPIPDPEVAAKFRDLDPRFVEEFHPILDGLTLAILQERAASPWLVDKDVIEVLKTLGGTLKTLSSGIYYESLPDGPVRLSLFRRLKQLLDELMKSDATPEGRVLKVSEAMKVLDFLTYVALANSSIRPKSRRYLDWIAERFGERSGIPQPSGLIIPG
jgi:hypothetical protein